ncbi:MAG: hypothetical protein M1820_007331, partial [Bogoriella megaspora]
SNVVEGTSGYVIVNGSSGMPLAGPSTIMYCWTDIDELSFNKSGNLFFSEDEIGVLFVPAKEGRDRKETQVSNVSTFLQMLML